MLATTSPAEYKHYRLWRKVCRRTALALCTDRVAGHLTAQQRALALLASLNDALHHLRTAQL